MPRIGSRSPSSPLRTAPRALAFLQMTDHFTYEEYVANVSQTSAKSLHGMLLCFDWNWKNGTMGPIFARVLQEAAVSRFEENRRRTTVHTTRSRGIVANPNFGAVS